MKIKHKFIFKELSELDPFDYSISYRFNWGGKEYGQYFLLREEDLETMWIHMRALVREKQFTVQSLTEKEK